MFTWPSPYLFSTNQCEIKWLLEKIDIANQDSIFKAIENIFTLNLENIKMEIKFHENLLLIETQLVEAFVNGRNIVIWCESRLLEGEDTISVVNI